jgi:hypothetical protein
MDNSHCIVATKRMIHRFQNDFPQTLFINIERFLNKHQLFGCVGMEYTGVIGANRDRVARLNPVFKLWMLLETLQQTAGTMLGQFQSHNVAGWTRFYWNTAYR